MNTHDPAFRRAFRRGKRFYGWRGCFAVIQAYDGTFYPVTIKTGFFFSDRWFYWNPDGKRWRRFDPAREFKKMQEAKNEKDAFDVFFEEVVS